MNTPLSRSQFKIKLREMAERHGIDLRKESFSEELYDIISLERAKARLSHSDHSTGEWRAQSEWPKEPEHD